MTPSVVLGTILQLIPLENRRAKSHRHPPPDFTAVLCKADTRSVPKDNNREFEIEIEHHKTESINTRKH